VPPKEEEN
jgi:hypothetical protein